MHRLLTNPVFVMAVTVVLLSAAMIVWAQWGRALSDRWRGWRVRRAYRPDPPLPRAQVLDGAVGQTVAAGFREWVRSVRVCPACQADGALEKEQTDEKRVYGSGPNYVHFTSFTQSIRCVACGWSMSFLHTDDEPRSKLVAPMHKDASGGPRTEWVVDPHGAPKSGRLFVGGSEPLVIEVLPEVTGSAAAVARLAAVFVVAALTVDLSELGDTAATELRQRVINRQLTYHGGTVMKVVTDQKAN